MDPTAIVRPVEESGIRGLVLSDLHLFARRSEGAARFALLCERLRQLDVLVLNGDIFDFRWSCLRDMEATQAAAAAWLRGLASDLPRCAVHFIMGNHDCLAAFQDQLAALADDLTNFHWHASWLRLGSAVFVHGDCVHASVNEEAFQRYREVWRNDRQRGPLGAAAYSCADRLGITRLVHAGHFPRRRTVRRIARYLDDASPGWRDSTRNCYFGHTHLPFARHEHEGIFFHNTGSAIRGMDFQPAVFETTVTC